MMMIRALVIPVIVKTYSQCSNEMFDDWFHSWRWSTTLERGRDVHQKKKINQNTRSTQNRKLYCPISKSITGDERLIIIIIMSDANRYLLDYSIYGLIRYLVPWRSSPLYTCRHQAADIYHTEINILSLLSGIT